jgi:hypothetical protein
VAEEVAVGPDRRIVEEATLRLLDGTEFELLPSRAILIRLTLLPQATASQTRALTPSGYALNDVQRHVWRILGV